jgi:hypothetical protein
MSRRCEKTATGFSAKAAVGSSMMTRRAFQKIARPMATAHRWLPSHAKSPFAQARASRIMLNGVSAALRTRVNPPSPITDDSLAKPACAPSAAPTG